MKVLVLPEGIDPCGERGEFHTCVTAGPMLSTPLSVCRDQSSNVMASCLGICRSLRELERNAFGDQALLERFREQPFDTLTSAFAVA